MPRQLSTFERDQARLARLSAHIIAKMSGAESYGLIDEALDFERQCEAVRAAWLDNRAPVKNCLSDYFGAADGRVDLDRVLANRRHLYSPLRSEIPRALQRYIAARNDRVARVREWNLVDRNPEQLVHEFVRLAKSGRAASRWVNQEFAAMRAARKKEKSALKKAIEGCCVEGLATPQSGQDTRWSLHSDPNFAPWQLGHVYLLHDLAVQDLETTPAQRKALGEIIKLLKRSQVDA